MKKVDTNAYDYGVPQTAVIAHSSTPALKTRPGTAASRILDKKQQKYLEKIGRNMLHSKSIGNHHDYQTTNGNKSQQQQQRVTSEIYVFARKRPKLECESNYDDVISIDQGSEFKNSSQGAPRSICVNECKTTVDGTAILRKVF